MLPRFVRGICEMQANCCAPAERCGTAQYFGRRERRKQSPNETVTASHAGSHKYTSYIAKMWAHYRTMIEGPPIVHNIVHKAGNCSESNPNQTLTHPELCHSCASQRQPDTMHNTNCVTDLGVCCLPLSLVMPIG